MSSRADWDTLTISFGVRSLWPGQVPGVMSVVTETLLPPICFAADSIKVVLTLTRIGAAAAGLLALQGGADPAEPDACVQAFLRPEPRVRLGLALGRNRAATACVDLSDGLADGLRQIAAASDVGLRIDAAALPIPPDARMRLGGGSDAIDAALRGGEDYELLFTVSPRRRGRFATARRLARGLPLTRIGLVVPGHGVVLVEDGQERPLPSGFVHFR